MRTSNSSIQTFKRCPRLWELQYKFGVRPTTISKPLETGLSYHDKVEQLIRNGQFTADGDPKTDAMAFAFKRYALPKIKEHYVPEVWFEYQTKGGNIIVGRFDAVGDNSILEHKSTSGRVDGAYWAGIELDEQLLTYMMASGKNRALYTVCQKPTLRKSQNETSLEFAERCKKWYETDTDYKIAVSSIVHTQEDIERHESEVDAICGVIENCNFFYRNTAFCKHWGKRCEYAQICREYDPEKTYIGFERKE